MSAARVTQAHTPGPWFYNPSVDFEEWLPCIGTAPDDGQGPCYTGEARVICQFRSEDAAPDDADRALMIAAPDLLAALKLSRAYLLGLMDKYGIAWSDWSDAHEIEAAIAKAEGK